MNQEQFAESVGAAGGVYIPFAGSEPHYELVGIGVIVGSGNDRIRVQVLKADGTESFGTWVHHAFGSDFERFQFNGEPVQFNLGAGSHYNVPNDPPDHITIESMPTDEVRVGNSSAIGFQHTEWSMTFKLTGGEPVPPPGDFVTHQELEAKHYVTEMNLPALVKQIAADRMLK